MPGRKALPYASKKENRMYEHIKASELARGLTEKTAKRIGGATVNQLRAKRGETKAARKARRK